jgi:hypothetical protein
MDDEEFGEAAETWARYIRDIAMRRRRWAWDNLGI